MSTRELTWYPQPDLPARLKDDLRFNVYNRATFYTPGSVGYVDYPFYSPAL